MEILLEMNQLWLMDALLLIFLVTVFLLNLNKNNGSTGDDNTNNLSIEISK